MNEQERKNSLPYLSVFTENTTISTWMIRFTNLKHQLTIYKDVDTVSKWKETHLERRWTYKRRAERLNCRLACDVRLPWAVEGGISCPQNSCEANKWGEWRGGTATASLAQLRTTLGSTATADRGRMKDRYWLCRGTAGKPPLSVHGLWLRGNRTRTSRSTPCASWPVECGQHSHWRDESAFLITTENLPRPRSKGLSKKLLGYTVV